MQKHSFLLNVRHNNSASPRANARNIVSSRSWPRPAGQNRPPSVWWRLNHEWQPARHCRARNIAMKNVKQMIQLCSQAGCEQKMASLRCVFRVWSDESHPQKVNWVPGNRWWYKTLTKSENGAQIEGTNRNRHKVRTRSFYSMSSNRCRHTFRMQ